ncbi:hypothetical protein [Agrobacterium larrymoorei]|uniref:Uncharacterized protein n=1 Tax=Agrobacterium larrymoorei TaxID=160699 RepID=A0A4D7DTE3_9HYPH|nr:hypothetical protein [Agrobacterium larrymoorei]QCJ00716.1 hypothetical protein CFBP5473_22250 [Agrobacterium larrymoorei]QYA10717.1 hypothetical protein J5285_24500 [Agrobacterium larrymoorei]
MIDDGTATIRAMVESRASADLAVEYLIQQQGIFRPDSLFNPSRPKCLPSSDKFPLVQGDVGDAGAIRVSGAV